ncbi:pyruvate dehydrogenase (acetyl-transferring) E1 component subunit alpha [Sinirhodobacter populi]|uniref:Pyruvate dehydrogenase E1 component subunit alpha n=1 Tax=Paenirhodobacter populi TaxID=2306993 RepID=A0A443K3S9_9RHOB|nr:pyruvate dehydrogenase (acetyl-transferring) E1 component subunit alpha [Sinirhodobacter populi]RWR27427.1 pyruvate dehydrogenase (acetyl-transferring) E1 component subunit alpha [Sinirhodobacter populi]
MNSSAPTLHTARNAVFSQDELFSAYRDSLLIRRFEEKAGQLYGSGAIGGFCHLYIGQEAIAVGVVKAAMKNDTFVHTYRDHGFMLALGMDPGRIMAELTGRRDGYSGGKGGSMHMFAPERGFLGGHGIVGAAIPIAAGTAFAHKYRSDGGISFGFMGDGASNQGQVYETFNMASLWKLPVVFVIENNQYGMGTSVVRHAAGPGLFRRGEGFGISGRQVDGMDVEEVYTAVSEAAEHARTGKGPVLLEMMTYRYRGHSMSDPAKYRSRQEVDQVRAERDGIEHIASLLRQRHSVTDVALKEIEKGVREVVGQAADFALASPEPDPSDLWTDIYSPSAPGASVIVKEETHQYRAE